MAAAEACIEPDMACRGLWLWGGPGPEGKMGGRNRKRSEAKVCVQTTYMYVCATHTHTHLRGSLKLEKADRGRSAKNPRMYVFVQFWHSFRGRLAPA